MSELFTARYSNKIIQDIKNNILCSYEEVYSSLLQTFHDTFRSKGLADMCWRLKEVHLPYARLRTLFHKYEYRFSSNSWWNNLSELKKEKLVPVIEKFENQTCIFCGLKYSCQFPKEIEEDEDSFTGPFVYFLPAFVCNEPVIAMQNFIGAKMYFSFNKGFKDYPVRMKRWKIGRTYSLPKLIANINNRKIKLSPNGDIFLKCSIK